ncbi:MAG TPA: hypothetical protein VH558_00850 [Pseudolabrys sp.]
MPRRAVWHGRAVAALTAAHVAGRVSAHGMNLAISKSTMPYLFGVHMPCALIGIYEIQREDS